MEAWTHTHGIRQNAMLKIALIMFTHTLRFLSLQTYHQILRGKYFFSLKISLLFCVKQLNVCTKFRFKYNRLKDVQQINIILDFPNVLHIADVINNLR